MSRQKSRTPNTSRRTTGRDGRDRPRLSVVTLGCPKNLVDTECMLARLTDQRFRFVPNPEQADVVLVNTCAFIEAARQESLEEIRQLIRLKRQGRIRGIVVAGCLAERFREQLLELCPGIDQVVTVAAENRVLEAAEAALVGSGPAVLDGSAQAELGSEDRRLRVTARHVAYMKIADGCDRKCSFCSIPAIRGRYVSKPIEVCVEEARQLAAQGVRELVLVAQDTSYYGTDLYGRPQLARLLEKLNEVEGLEWIRLMYLYPLQISDAVIETINSLPRVLPYLDIPLQHVSDPILKAMRRGIDKKQTEELLDRLRSRISGLVLRTTFLVGFPGETEQHFAELLEFVKKWQFEHVGVFAYSKEPGTPAEQLPDQVPQQVAEQRRARLLEVQQEVVAGWASRQMGKTFDVVIDLPLQGESDVYVGRTYAQAPDVDGWVYVTGQGLMSGQFVPCELVAVQGYDFCAVPVGSPR